MHELSIAYSIVESSSQAAKQAGADSVESVKIRLGILSGVVKQSLLFSWSLAAEETLLAGSRLEIEEVPIVVHCPICAKDVELPEFNYFRCPLCDTPTPTVIQGKELEIVSMEIPEAIERSY